MNANILPIHAERQEVIGKIDRGFKFMGVCKIHSLVEFAIKDTDYT
jgi:hypothetical protein